MEEILFYIAAVIFLIILVTLVVFNIVKAVKKHKAKKQIALEEKSFSTEVKVKNDVRYTEGNSVETKEGDVNVSYQQKDLVLNINKTYIVGKKNKIMPGKYTLLSVNDGVTSFSMRVNGIVSTFSHGCNMVFAEGDIVCPTSQNIILR